MPFLYKQRVYYQDTDASGVVYHANYFRYADAARTEWLLDRGITNKMLKEHHFGFVVRHADITYSAPARYQDTILIETRIEKMRPVGAEMEHIFSRGAQVLATMKLSIVFIDTDTFRPRRLPKELEQFFLKGENHAG